MINGSPEIEPEFAAHNNELEWELSADDPTTTSAEDPVVDSSNADAHTAVEDDIRRWGWIPLWRAYQDEWWWEQTPWSLAQVYFWLLLSANVRSRKQPFRGNLILVERGCTVTSFTKLAERAGISRKALTRLLNLLEQGGKVEFVYRGRQGIHVRICNYDACTFTSSRRDNDRYNRRTTDDQADAQPSDYGLSSQAQRKRTPQQGNTADRQKGQTGPTGRESGR